MVSGDYGAFADPYVYPGTAVLRNKLGIQDAAKLQAFEVEISTFRTGQPFPRGRLGETHYRKIHHRLFGDVYEWAGRYRTVRMAKGDNVFCYPENIGNEMERAFGRLADRGHLRTKEADAFVHGAAEFLADLNAIHPFREGNGRTQLAFLAVLAQHAEHPLRLDRVRQKTFLAAMIASFDRDLEPLMRELRELLGEGGLAHDR